MCKVNDLFFISICFPKVNTFNFIKFIHSYKVCEWTSLFYQSSSDLDKMAVFVRGSSNFKLEFVISHETSEQHLRSVGKQSVKENSTVNSD
jgi:hypothetical protein